MKHFDEVVKSINKSLDFYSGIVARHIKEDKEDIRQDLLIKAWKASKKYKEKRGKIKTFYIHVLKNEMKTIISKSFRPKWTKSISLSAIENFEELFPDHRQSFVHRLEMDGFWNRVRTKLKSNPLALKVLNLLLEEDQSFQCVAKKMGISREYVGHTLFPIIAETVYSADLEKKRV